MQPATVPILDATNTVRISAVPMTSSRLIGCQHAGHGDFQLVHRVINDAVVADLHAIALGQLARAGIGAGVETDDERLGRNRQVHIGFADAAHGGVHELDLDFVGRQLEQRGTQCLLRALHIRLDDDGQGLDLAARHLGEHVVQLGRLLAGQLGVAELARTVGGNFACAALVAEHHELVAGLRHLGQTLDLHRDRRARILDGCRFRRASRARGRRSGLPAPRHRSSACRTGSALWPPDHDPCRGALR
jgi:hypothetical protein